MPKLNMPGSIGVRSGVEGHKHYFLALRADTHPAVAAFCSSKDELESVVHMFLRKSLRDVCLCRISCANAPVQVQVCNLAFQASVQMPIATSLVQNMITIFALCIVVCVFPPCFLWTKQFVQVIKQFGLQLICAISRVQCLRSKVVVQTMCLCANYLVQVIVATYLHKLSLRHFCAVSPHKLSCAKSFVQVLCAISW